MAVSPRRSRTPRAALVQPTAEQIAIQRCDASRLIVEAHAGTGKTTTLALCIAQALDAGTPPDRILALTYTAPAVEALGAALARVGIDAARRRAIAVRTFDDFAAERLRALEGSAPRRLDDAEALRPWVLDALRRLAARSDPRRPMEFAGSLESRVDGLLTAFVWLKGTLILTHDAAGRPLTTELADELGQDDATLRAFNAFEALRRGVDTDRPAFRSAGDATYDLARLLLDDDAWLGDPHPLALDLRFLVLDEMHDTHRSMFTVLRALLEKNPELRFVGVGDRKQVIHSIAGADATFMGETFDREAGPATRRPLSRSQRYGETLARAVERLSGDRCSGKPGQSTDIVVTACRDAHDSALRIVAAIESRAGPLSDVAVLLRWPHQSVALENRLLERGIDYRTDGFPSYLLRPEVLFVRGLIAYARDAFEAIESAASRARILQALLRFCGAERRVDDPTALAERVAGFAATPRYAVGQIDEEILQRCEPVLRRRIDAAVAVIRADSTDRLLQGFVAALDPAWFARRMLVRRDDIEQVGANIDGLIASAREFDDVDAFFRGMNERERRQEGMSSKSQRVLMASIEAAKGREFDEVLMPGLGAARFASGDDPAGDRNLFYVGITRARSRLSLYSEGPAPSPYLHAAGLLAD